MHSGRKAVDHQPGQNSSQGKRVSTITWLAPARPSNGRHRESGVDDEVDDIVAIARFTQLGVAYLSEPGRGVHLRGLSENSSIPTL